MNIIIKSNLKKPTLNQVLEFLLQLGQRLVHLVPLLLLHQKRVSTGVHQPIIWKPIGNYVFKIRFLLPPYKLVK